MRMASNYSKSLYDDFVKLSNRFEELEKNSKQEITDLKGEIRVLKKEIQEKDELIEKLIEEKEKY